MLRFSRVTDWVEVDATGTDGARLTFDRTLYDESNRGTRCRPGYVIVSLEGADSGVFSIRRLRQALDEYERAEGDER